MQLNYMYARKHGCLTDEQRQGSLALLFKKGDRLDVAMSIYMYRPVAVLRADFKIAALIQTFGPTPVDNMRGGPDCLHKTPVYPRK